MNYRYLKNSIISLIVIFLVFGAPCVLASGLFDNMTIAVKGTELEKNSDPIKFIGGIVNVILALLGLVLVIVIIYAGAVWGFFSGGDTEKIKKARNMIINAIIGLAIVFASYAITIFVIDRLTEASRGSQQLNPKDNVTDPATR